MITPKQTQNHQVSSSVNQDLISACSTLATVLYHSGDIAGALRQQQQAMSLMYQVCATLVNTS